MNREQHVWLSHVLSETTPAYGGAKGLSICPDKSISAGDSCNTVQLAMPNHLGSHVDAPLHFVDEGKGVDAYGVDEWCFSSPLLLDLKITEADIIAAEQVEKLINDASVKDADLVLIRTGIETYRPEARFWEKSPGFSSDLADLFFDRFPSFCAIGMDAISISSYQHRLEGRRAHGAFLGRGARIFEDLHLSHLPANSFALSSVRAFPLRFEQADGAPVTVVGTLNLGLDA